MSDRATEPEYLNYQYGDSEKLRIRIETHRRFSQQPDEFPAWVLAQVAPRAGGVVLDVGCGPGSFHEALARHGMRVLGIDTSEGMLREARQQAVDKALAVVLARATAEALPVADASCDRALAAHVLFHVPDPLLALREMRRVVKRGGRVVITTNAADHSARLHELHTAATRELGYTPTAKGSARFSLDDLPAVRSVFSEAELHVLPNAFLFPTAEAALRFYATGLIDAIRELPSDGSHRPRLLASVGPKIQEIIDREGVFRVPKDAGGFVAVT